MVNQIKKTGDTMRLSPHIPSRPWRDLKYALWLPLYLLLFLALERMPTGRYWATQLPVDARIPFCEWFIIPYCLWYPFLVLTGLYLLRRDRAAFRRYMLFLGITFFASELIWFVLPNGQDLRPAAFSRENLLTALAAGLYRIDTNTNVFPSVHVLGSVGAALAVRDCRCSEGKPLLRAGAALLAAAICLSTVFIKQHSVLDVVGGLLLGGLTARLVYRSSPAFRPSREEAPRKAPAHRRHGQKLLRRIRES
ncbi:MAG: phosphatase PAP2 family protein [Oscillibacter sp.]|jgi:membrane-associated phospholipid phosphatase|nr:phosphatase PAP2 family protein [uncultured Oscillibacter sp.]MCI8813085.1 phosphatase PAP2 family protein [Oscillibacter sp.]